MLNKILKAMYPDLVECVPVFKFSYFDSRTTAFNSKYLSIPRKSKFESQFLLFIIGDFEPEILSP